MLETQTGFKLERFCTDGGREFDNALFAKWLSHTGGVWEPTSRESPEQNASESLNRTIWDRARPTMLATGLGVQFLSSVVQYAVHIRNLTVSVGRKNNASLSYVWCQRRFIIVGGVSMLSVGLIPLGTIRNGKLAACTIKGMPISLGPPLESPAYLVHSVAV